MSRFIPRQLQDRKTLAMLGLQAAAITAFGPHGWITGPCILGASLSYIGWLHYSKNKSIRHSVRQQYDPLQLPYIERTCEALPDMDGEGIIRLIQHTEMLTATVLTGHRGSDLASVNWSRGGFTCWSPEQWLVHQANNPMRPEDWQSVWTTGLASLATSATFRIGCRFMAAFRKYRSQACFRFRKRLFQGRFETG